MDEFRFWEIVQHAHDQSDGEMDGKCELIKSTVSALSKEDARAFASLFDSMMDRAYSWSLWGAAYVIQGGCSDDSFSDFRASLISRGRDAFEGALSAPDSMASENFDEDEWFYEGYEYAVTEGVQASVGSAVNRETPHPKDPSGQEWDEDSVYLLYPELSEKFA